VRGRKAREYRRCGPHRHNRQHQNRAFSANLHSLRRTLLRSIARRDLDHVNQGSLGRTRVVALDGCHGPIDQDSNGWLGALSLRTEQRASLGTQKMFSARY
jgi:hypothetical protein